MKLNFNEEIKWNHSPSLYNLLISELDVSRKIAQRLMCSSFYNMRMLVAYQKRFLITPKK